jgi:hypothetical protein
MTSRASERVRQAELSARRDRLQERNYSCSVIGGCEAAIRLHVVAGNDLIRVCDEALEFFLVPDEACALQCTSCSPAAILLAFQ